MLHHCKFSSIFTFVIKTFLYRYVKHIYIMSTQYYDITWLHWCMFHYLSCCPSPQCWSYSRCPARQIWWWWWWRRILLIIIIIIITIVKCWPNSANLWTMMMKDDDRDNMLIRIMKQESSSAILKGWDSDGQQTFVRKTFCQDSLTVSYGWLRVVLGWLKGGLGWLRVVMGD